MFSPLVKGNGTWDGRLELLENEFEKPCLGDFFPSILKMPSPDAASCCQEKAETVTYYPDDAHCIQLPKTYLTRKGAIVLFATPQSVHCIENQEPKQLHYNDYGHSETSVSSSTRSQKGLRKSGLQIGNCKKDESQNMSSSQKQKLFLSFFNTYIRDQDAVCNFNQENLYKSNQPVVQTQTEDGSKLLSQPKTIGSLHRHSPVGPRKNIRPNTAPVLPPEPDQPRAHPRMTSAKPNRPTRALGKLPFRNSGSQFKHEVASRLESFGAGHSPKPTALNVDSKIKRPNSCMTSELVQCGRLAMQSPAIENSVEHVEGIRRASSGSRSSSLLMMDRESLARSENDSKLPAKVVYTPPPHLKENNLEAVEGIENLAGRPNDFVLETDDTTRMSRPSSSLRSSVNEKSIERDICEMKPETDNHFASEGGELSSQTCTDALSLPVPSIQICVGGNSHDNGVCNVKHQADDYLGLQDGQMSKISSQVCSDAVSQSVSSIKSSVREKSNDNSDCIMKPETDDYPSLQTEHTSKTSFQIRTDEKCQPVASIQLHVSDKSDDSGICMIKPETDGYLNLEDEKMSKTSFQVCSDAASQPVSPMPSSVREKCDNGGICMVEPETADYLGLQEGQSCTDAVSRPVSTRHISVSERSSDDVIHEVTSEMDTYHDFQDEQMSRRFSLACSSNHDFAETWNISTPQAGSGGGTCRARSAPCSRNSQVCDSKQGIQQLRNVSFQEDGSGCGSRFVRSATCSRTYQVCCKKEDRKETRNLSPVERGSDFGASRVRSAPSSSENSSTRYSGEVSSRKAFSAGFYKPLPKSPDEFVDNAISHTPAESPVCIPSATSVYESQDEQYIVSSKQDLGEDTNVFRKELKDDDGTKTVEASDETSLTESFSSVLMKIKNKESGSESDELISDSAQLSNNLDYNLETSDQPGHNNRTEEQKVTDQHKPESDHDDRLSKEEENIVSALDDNSVAEEPTAVHVEHDQPTNHGLSENVQQTDQKSALSDQVSSAVESHDVTTPFCETDIVDSAPHISPAVSETSKLDQTGELDLVSSQEEKKNQKNKSEIVHSNEDVMASLVPRTRTDVTSNEFLSGLESQTVIEKKSNIKPGGEDQNKTTVQEKSDITVLKKTSVKDQDVDKLTSKSLPGNDSLKHDEKSQVAEKPKKMTEEKKSVAKMEKESLDVEKLDVQGVGKAEKDHVKAEEKTEVKVQNKVDLSGLKNLIEKKITTKNKIPSSKKSRSPKSNRKKVPPADSSPSLEVIPAIDENLIKILENQDGTVELTDEALDHFAPEESFREPDLYTLPEDKPSKNSGAHSPSKVKKASRKRVGRKNNHKISEKNKEAEDRRKKILEEKEKREEELRLLKEREMEQKRLLEEVKEKQRTIEEERQKRLLQEAQARKMEEEAEAALREARRKAREDREKRREEEAERRRQDVQRKREEKRMRELEIQKREQELEKQKVDRDQRMAELRAQREREKKLEEMAEQQRKEEERLRLLKLEEERKLEEDKIKEAEEALQHIMREREYREQMRRIAEAQQAKLEKEETERRLRELEERAAIEEQRQRLKQEREQRENEERERIRQLRQQEAIARIRAAHEASKRRTWALRRREKNLDRMAHLTFTRQSQRLTEAFTFTYHVHIPRNAWELPYSWNSKKKRGFRSLTRKKKPSNGD